MTIPKHSVAKATTAKKTTATKTATIAAASPVTKLVKATGTAKKESPKKATRVTKSKATPSTLTHEHIAKLAYQYSLKNQMASAEENWLKAEAKLLSKAK